MKLLYVLLILMALAGVYAYLRLRPYIKAARQIFGAVRGSGRVTRGLGDDEAFPPRQDRPASETLVRCASCDTWLPASRAVTPGGSGAQFCSNACLESAAEGHRRAQKSAS